MAVKERNPWVVLLLSLITLGIYGIYWIVATTNELREKSDEAPSPWLLLLFLIPLVNFFVMIYYYWKYSSAINELTGFSKAGLFILWLFVNPAAMVVSQYQLNKVAQE